MNKTRRIIGAALLGIALAGGQMPGKALASAQKKIVAAERKAWGQDGTYEIAKEDPGTRYSHRENWAHPRPDYFTTTSHPDKEGGRFDPSKPPTGNYVGTATTVFEKVPPGRYVVEVFYRRTENRSKKVPWNVKSDGTKANRASGVVDQFLRPNEAGKWWPLAETVATPIEVAGKIVLVWGSDTDNGGRSISYGGARVRRVE